MPRQSDVEDRKARARAEVDSPQAAELSTWSSLPGREARALRGRYVIFSFDMSFIFPETPVHLS